MAWNINYGERWYTVHVKMSWFIYIHFDSIPVTVQAEDSLTNDEKALLELKEFLDEVCVLIYQKFIHLREMFAYELYFCSSSWSDLFFAFMLILLELQFHTRWTYGPNDIPGYCTSTKLVLRKKLSTYPHESLGIAVKDEWP